MAEKLINLYEKEECLWRPSHPDYFNKDKRKQAIRNIANEMQYTEEFVKKKLANFRTYFIKEYKKVNSHSSGQGSDDNYISQWEHYTDLQFLTETLKQRKSLSNLSMDTDIDTEESFEIEPEKKKTKIQAFQVNSSPSTSAAKQNVSTTDKTKKRVTVQMEMNPNKCPRIDKKKQDKDSIEEKILNALKTDQDPDIQFGMCVANWLKQIESAKEKDIAKLKIHSFLLDSIYGNIEDDS